MAHTTVAMVDHGAPVSAEALPMTHENQPAGVREQLLNPLDRISEVLFGLIMAVMIIGSLSIASAGPLEALTLLAAALG